MTRRLAWALLAMLGAAAPAAAQGVLYRYELHDATFHTRSLHDGAAAPFSVHRVGVIDESGVFASGLMTMAGAQKTGEGKDEKGRDVDYYLLESKPVVPGIRASLELAFEGPTDLDVDVDGQRQTDDTRFDYFELRIAIGGSGTIGGLGYYALDAVDFVARDVSGHTDTARFGNDQYSLYFGGEVGVAFPLVRVGAYARYDWIRGLGRVLALGDDDSPAHTYDAGLAAALGAEGLRLEARWGLYQWSDEDSAGGGVRDVEGSLLSFGGQAAF